MGYSECDLCQERKALFLSIPFMGYITKLKFILTLIHLSIPFMGYEYEWDEETQQWILSIPFMGYLNFP